MINKYISQAIKASRWLSIEYENINGEITKYWIAIKKINIERKSFLVDAFNISKISNEYQGLIETWISFDRIQDAFVVNNTTYEQPKELIQDINRNIKSLDWLGYDSYDDEILDYIQECMQHEEVAYQREFTLVRGIDSDSLENLPLNNKYKLSIEQISDLVPKLERLSKNDQQNIFEIVTLAFNLLSINTNKGLFVIAYKELSFNPIEKALVLSPNTLFNYDFYSDQMKEYKHNLKNYLDIETDDFTKLFIENKELAKDLLMKEVKRYKGESIDDRPYIMELRRSYYAHIEKEIHQIKLYKLVNKLSTPLEAFFGNMSKDKLNRRSGVDVVVLDNKANIDQLRVIYNALIQPITYVQGPPGTGKTSTIINVLISAFFNGQTVLVSSNNNKPISDIFLKFQNLKSKDIPIPLPFLRLGNSDETLKSLNGLKEIINRYQKYQSDESKLELRAQNKKKKLKEINMLLDRYEHIIELEEEIDALKLLQEKLNDNLKKVSISAILNSKENELSKLKPVNNEDIEPLLTKVDNNFLTWLFFTSIKNIKRIFEPKNKELLDIIQSDNDDEKVKAFNSYTAKEEKFHNLIRIFPIILTTNQSAYKLGPQKPYFDLVIIDEAGQCSIGPSLFAISRGKRLLLVGDQNQLSPVISIAPETNRVLMSKYQISSAYDYLKNSILLTMQKQDTISKFVLLRYHYRSRREIIEFSNKKYYKNQLKVLTPKDTFTQAALEFIHIDSSKTPKQAERNISIAEGEAILSSLKTNNYKSVGVITPFRNQAALLKDMLSNEGYGHIDVGTIHTFQGDEKDVIFLSCAITKHSHDKTFDWVKNNQELLNVATTRAKKKFILVADTKEIKKRSSITNDLYELTTYVMNNGKNVELTESNTTQYINGANFRNYNTKKEQEFIDTINHILTLNYKFVLKHKVRVASILDNFTDPVKYDYGLKSEFDLVIFKKINNLLIPLVVVELDGEEHYIDSDVRRRDELKEKICKDNNITLIRIHNDYSRRYMYIKEILLDVLK